MSMSFESSVETYSTALGRPTRRVFVSNVCVKDAQSRYFSEL
jgi:hypothetical protein